MARKLGKNPSPAAWAIIDWFRAHPRDEFTPHQLHHLADNPSQIISDANTFIAADGQRINRVRQETRPNGSRVSYYRIAKRTPALADELTTRRARNPVQAGQGLLISVPSPPARDRYPD